MNLRYNSSCQSYYLEINFSWQIDATVEFLHKTNLTHVDLCDMKREVFTEQDLDYTDVYFK